MIEIEKTLDFIRLTLRILLVVAKSIDINDHDIQIEVEYMEVIEVIVITTDILQYSLSSAIFVLSKISQ